MDNYFLFLDNDFLQSVDRERGFINKIESENENKKLNKYFGCLRSHAPFRNSLKERKSRKMKEKKY